MQYGGVKPGKKYQTQLLNMKKKMENKFHM